MRTESLTENAGRTGEFTAGWTEVPRHISATQNCIWLRAPWGGDEDGLKRRALREMGEERYRKGLARVLKSELLYLTPNDVEHCLNIKIRGGMLRDFGDYLEVENGTDREVATMVKALRFKGWRTVEVTGSLRFREQALVECLRHGIQVLGCQIPEHTKARLLEQAKPVAAPTLAATAFSPRREPLPELTGEGESEHQMVASVEEYLLDMLAE